jgi:precorrin-6B methylase 1
MNPAEMIVLIVLIVTIGRVLSRRYGYLPRGKRGAVGFVDDSASSAEAARLRAEVNRLNDRIQVLERLATDPAKRLSDEIDALKTETYKTDDQKMK